MTFAGDIPAGAYARFMKANFDRLIDGAEGGEYQHARHRRSCRSRDSDQLRWPQARAKAAH